MFRLLAGFLFVLVFTSNFIASAQPTVDQQIDTILTDPRFPVELKPWCILNINSTLHELLGPAGTGETVGVIISRFVARATSLHNHANPAKSMFDTTEILSAAMGLESVVNSTPALAAEL